VSQIAAGAAHGFARFWIKDLPDPSPWPALVRLDNSLTQRASWRETTPYLPAGAGFPAL
jgi:hypothetical protein